MEIRHKVVLIRIAKTYHVDITDEGLYEATRGVWRVGVRREGAEYAVAVFNDQILEVYAIDSWQPAGTDIYKTRTFTQKTLEGRSEFVGHIATSEIRQQYLDQSVSEHFRKGQQNPIRYLNC